MELTLFMVAMETRRGGRSLEQAEDGKAFILKSIFCKVFKINLILINGGSGFLLKSIDQAFILEMAFNALIWGFILKTFILERTSKVFILKIRGFYFLG